MKKKILVIICFIILMGAFLLINPYNLYHHFTAEKKVMSIFSDPMVRESALGDNSEITNVNYFGSHIYLVETEGNTFLVQFKPDKSSYTIDVFEHIQHVKQFKGLW